MSFVKDFLFGSKGTPGKVHDVTPDEFERLRGPLAQAMLQQFQNPQGFQGPLTAEMSDAERQLLTQLQGFSPATGFQQQALNDVTGLPMTAQQMAIQALLGGGAGGVTDFRRQALQQLSGGPQAELLGQTVRGDFLSPSSNPFLADTIAAAQRPILEQFGDQTQELRAQFARAGHTLAPESSSPFDMARARLASGVASALGDVGTRIGADNLARERALQGHAVNQIFSGLQTGAGIEQNMGQQMLQALTGAAGIEQGMGQQRLQGAQVGSGIEQGINQQALEGLMTNLQAQALPRLIEDMGIERGLQEFQRQQAQLLQSLGITGTLAQPTVATTQGTAGSSGFLGGLAGGVGRGIGNLIGGGG